MNKKQLIVVWVTVVLLISNATAEESVKDINRKEWLSTLVSVITEDEAEIMHKDLLSWTDSKMIQELSKITITDEYIKKIYAEFKTSIVTPPNPDTYKEYSIKNGEWSLGRIIQLGHKVHNLGVVMSDKDFERFGKLIQNMRDVLCIDSKHIPLAIKHDNSRDVYWYEFHNVLVKHVEDGYDKLFAKTKE